MGRALTQGYLVPFISNPKNAPRRLRCGYIAIVLILPDLVVFALRRPEFRAQANVRVIRILPQVLVKILHAVDCLRKLHVHVATTHKKQVEIVRYDQRAFFVWSNVTNIPAVVYFSRV